MSSRVRLINHIDDNKKLDSEICNECGSSVAFGGGLFVNRVYDLNDKETRRLMGKPYPSGEFICPKCDYQIYNNLI